MDPLRIRVGIPGKFSNRTSWRFPEGIPVEISEGTLGKLSKIIFVDMCQQILKDISKRIPESISVGIPDVIFEGFGNLEWVYGRFSKGIVKVNSIGNSQALFERFF